MESNEVAATAKGTECSGRGSGGETELGGQGWALAPVTTLGDRADARELEATDGD